MSHFKVKPNQNPSPAARALMWMVDHYEAVEHTVYGAYGDPITYFKIL